MLVQILGPLVVGAAGPAPRRQLRLVLAALAIEHDRYVSGEELIELLWPGSRPDDRRKALQIQVSRIRSLLGSESTDDVVDHRDGAYRLRLDEGQLDAARFRRCVELADDAVGPDEQIALLQEALDLWRGDVVEDFPELGSHPASVGLAGRRWEALEQWARLLLDRGRPGSIVAEMEAANRSEPFREGLWACRALALARTGRQSAALAVCREVADLLRSELGLDVGPELADIELRILRGEVGGDEQPTSPIVVAPVPAIARSETPFVGREEELGELHDLLLDPLGITVVVDGMAGAGKTRLVAELLARLDEEAVVAVGRASEAASAPFSAIVDAIGALIDRLDEGSRRSLADSIDSLTAVLPELAGRTIDGVPLPQVAHELAAFVGRLSGGGRFVFVLDDAHWADAESLDLLARVRHAHDTALSIILVCRPSVPGDPLDRGPLSTWMTDGDVRRIAVEGLSGSQVEEYVERLAGHALDQEGRAFARLLHGETGGNPFFLTEVVRHLVENGGLVSRGGRWRTARLLTSADVPRTVREVVRSRLDRLDLLTAEIVRALSAIGRPAARREIAAVAAIEGDEAVTGLARAQRVGLVDELVGGRFDVSHALVRDVVLDALDAEARAGLHERAADVARGSDDDDAPFELVQQLRAARGATEADARLVAAALDAAHAAVRRRAHGQAVGQLQIAHQHASTTDDRQLAEIEIRLAESGRNAGEPAAYQWAFTAADRARLLDDADLLAEAAASVRPTGWAGPVGVRDEDYEALLNEAIDHPLVHPASRARLQADLAGAVLHTSAGSRRIELFRDALAAAEAHGDGTILRRVLSAAMVLDDRSMLVEQRRCVERLIELASAAGDVAALRHGHNIGIVAAFSAGDIAAIERHRIELTRTAHVLREPHGLWAETTWRSSVALLHGRLREAEELSEEAFGLGLSAGVPDTRAMAMFGGQLMELRRLQGRLDELSGVADSMGGGSELSVWDYGLALIAAESEPVDETAARVEALVAGGGPFEHGVGWGASAAVCVLLADRAGRADLCQRIIVDTAAFGDRLASSGAASTGPMSLFLGRAARAAGDLERSIAWLHQAADHARRMAAPVSEAEATIELAAALQLDGADPSHVERLLDDAVGVALDRGAAGLVARADDVAAGCR